MEQHDGMADAITQAAERIHEPRPITETLQTIVHVARDTLPGIDHAGITLAHRDGRLETPASTDPFVLELDRIQYELADGPCVSALADDEPFVVVEHAHHEARWHGFIPRAVELGLRAALAVRLFDASRTVGVLNLYSTEVDTVDLETRHLAELFATHAAMAYGHSRRLNDLQGAVESRQMIGQAVGIVMERYGLTSERAFEHLVCVSSTQEMKLRDLARVVVDTAEESRQRRTEN